jgi:asparagine synthase (glutamine-hydrolysing)
MCGIAGFATADGSTPDRQLVKAMADTIAHRGPDGEGYLIQPGIGFGHRRLSIIDLAGGAQPIADEREDCWVMFNGEIYNFLELRPDLEARGHAFRTRSDTEVIVHLFEEKGAAAIPLLRGMFAIAAWDRRSRTLMLARDRAGKKPLYWFADGRGIYFASEIKALLLLPNCPREIDPAAIDLYLAYEAIPGTGTIFKGVHRLAPASVLTWTPSTGPRIETYWRADWRTKTTMPYEEAKRHLRELIVDATRARLISDVPLGAFLSGGVDSSAVVSAMAECSSGPVKTFSIGFPQQDFDETRYARMVAHKFGTTHEEFIVEPNAIEILPTLAWQYDQPFADSSALPTFYVSRMTRQRVTVALNGDGGDELFGGYERYRALIVRGLYHAATTPAVRGLAERLARAMPGSSSAESSLRKVRMFADAARGTLDEFNLRMFNHRMFEGVERRRLYSPDFAARLGSVDADRYFLERMVESAEQAGSDPVDRALWTDTQMYLPDTLLVKVDIAAMSVSLEGRSPLLDTNVMEFAASLPRTWKVTARQTKKILKEAHEGILPHDVLYRRKMGFSVPIKHWLRSELYSYTRDILLDPASIRRGYFRRDVVERLLEDHRAGRRNNATRLWALLMLEHWHREILEGSKARANQVGSLKPEVRSSESTPSGIPLHF